jgi:alpha-glucosidase (family GH31 glycosyl hydrolase)
MHRLRRLSVGLILLVLALPESATAKLIVKPDSLIFSRRNVQVQIELPTLRLRFGPVLAAPIAEQVAGGSVTYERDGVSFALGRVVSHVLLDDFSLRLYVHTTEPYTIEAAVTLEWLTERALRVTIEPPPQSPFLPPDAPLRLPVAVSDAYRLTQSELIYGLTERIRDSQAIGRNAFMIEDIQPVEAGSLNRRGETIAMYVWPTFSLYAPFYQSSRGYGLAVDGTMPGTFDVGKGKRDVLRFRFEAQSREQAGVLSYELFYGPSHDQINDEYTALSGRPARIPDFALKHWRWRDELTSGKTAMLDGQAVNADLADDVLSYERYGIPFPGLYHFDRPYTSGDFGFNKFDFDPARLPNIDATLDSLRRRGIEIGVFTAAWAVGSRPDENGTEAKRLGYLSPDVDREIDLTNAQAYAWWRDKVAAFVRKYNIRALKLDRGEEIEPPDDALFSDGRRAREIHNAYLTLQARVHRDALTSVFGDDSQALLWARAGYRGTQAYEAFWGGDAPGSTNLGQGPGTDLGLRYEIIAAQRAAFMGVPIWGSDTGGYYQFKDRDVFARWLEFSAFCPIMEIGGGGTHAPWDMPTDPHLDLGMIEIYRRYVTVHHSLVPYGKAAVERAHATGRAIVRPLSFDFPNDRHVADLWDEYMYGPDLLVAPLWRIGDRSRQVYLPFGDWTDFWDHSLTYRGPVTLKVAAPLDKIPVFVRGRRLPSLIRRADDGRD